MLPPWQGAQKPHAKNDVTTLQKRTAKQGSRVNCVGGIAIFFLAAYVTAYRRTTLSGLIEPSQVEIARL